MCQSGWVTELSPMLTITIVPEDDLPEFLAARERGEIVSAEDIMADGFRYATSAEADASEDDDGATDADEEGADSDIEEGAGERQSEAVAE